MQSGFFLGANSKSGFCSKYHALIDLKDAARVFILKGSPGCGKSTFMRTVSQTLHLDTCNIYCSSDPDSLDAVIFPALGVALVDGTAPHVVEPTYPLAVEEYINLGAFVNQGEVAKRRAEIIETTDRYKRQFGRVYRLTACAGLLSEDLQQIALQGIDRARLLKKAKGIIARELRNTGHPGKLHERFLSAISPKGYVTLFDTIFALADRVFALEDSYGVGHDLLAVLCDSALALGHTVYACYSPLCPERLEHLILPEARLAFVTASKRNLDQLQPDKRMHLDATLDQTYLRANRGKLRFAKSLSSELIQAACEELANGKRIHDELESLYHPCIDFEKITAAAKTLAAELSAQ